MDVFLFFSSELPLGEELLGPPPPPLPVIDVREAGVAVLAGFVLPELLRAVAEAGCVGSFGKGELRETRERSIPGGHMLGKKPLLARHIYDDGVLKLWKHWTFGLGKNRIYIVDGMNPRRRLDDDASWARHICSLRLLIQRPYKV